MEVQRKLTRDQFLDASVVHVERALLARARELERDLAEKLLSGESVGAIDLIVSKQLTEEFRKLAEELHYW